MHFLFISTMEGACWAGSGKSWSRTAEELIERGHNVSVCSRCRVTIPLALAVLCRKGAVAHFRKPLPLLWCLLDGLQDPIRVLISRISPDLFVMSQGSNFEGLQWMLANGALSMPYAPITLTGMPRALVDRASRGFTRRTR